MQGFYDKRSGSFKVEIEISGTAPSISRKVIALFDTGHNGTLSVPILDLIAIGAKLKSFGPVTYASGYGGVNYHFEVDVKIDGVKKTIVASMIENPDVTEAIAGVQLFADYITVINFTSKGILFTTEAELKQLTADGAKNQK